jgi:hypothetical protein
MKTETYKRKPEATSAVGSGDLLGVMVETPSSSGENHLSCQQTGCYDSETKQPDAACSGFVISQYEQTILKNLLLRLLGNSYQRPSSESLSPSG